MKYDDLWKIVQAPYFSISDPVIAREKLYSYQLNLWVRKGHLLRLKNGVYAFTREKDRIQGEEIAAVMCEPSYLSLESALAWYGFIPEMVYAYVSVTSRINRKYTNVFGTFIYRHIKPSLFWGYREIKTSRGRVLLAEPEKALIDYLYLNLAHISDENDFENLRFNLDVIHEKIDPDKMKRYLSAFGGKKLEKWALACLP